MPLTPLSVPDDLDSEMPAAPTLEMHDMFRPQEVRNRIYSSVFDSINKFKPLEDDRFRLTLSNVKWMDPERFTRRERKEAVLGGGTLGRRIKGTWTLEDKTTGTPIETMDKVVARVPYLSSAGTYTYKGSEYTLQNQQRLRPGIYTRVKDNGELESHFNALPGKGVSHRYELDPAKQVFKIKLGQAHIPLYPLLKAMGAKDGELQDLWGSSIFEANAKQNAAQSLLKLQQHVLPKKELRSGKDFPTLTQALVDVFNKTEVDPSVTMRTLKHPYTHGNKDTLLAITKKLLAVSRGEDKADDRDHLAYQQFFGPEDLFSERVNRDVGNYRKTIFREITKKGNLSKLPSGFFTRQLDDVLLGSGLAQPLEEINPLEILDKRSKMTRMGYGGISSLDSIPDSSRSVSPSQMGFIDPIRTPESLRAGIDVNLARGTRKGSDRQIYTKLIDAKTGEEVWKSPEQIADAAIATKGSWKWDTKRIPVMKSGRTEYATRDKTDYILPSFEDATSPLSNLVALKSAEKPGRLAMGARYITQALPLRKPEAPFVQTALPEDKTKSFEDYYADAVGVKRARSGGQVVGLQDGVLKLKYDDGTDDEVELYENHPLNRKTYWNQTPIVKPGDRFGKDQLLVKSNFSDDNGQVAVGANFRTAYLPWRGHNFKDAILLSESAADRLSSQHMYQHALETTNLHKLGKKEFVSMYPQKYTKEVLDRFDDNGLLKPGQVVEYGDPLVLAIRQQEHTTNKILKPGQSSYVDDSVTWKHHSPGTVTDVVMGKKGPMVAVQSESKMEVGDKLSGRHGDKGVVAKILPDHQMPTDANGKPFEVLLSPLGIVSRANPSQVIEGWLGKIARQTGKPYKIADFDDIEDLTKFAQDELRKNGLSAYDDIIDPQKGIKIPQVATGERYLMKLHHVAESKAQGRNSGAYNSDGTPAKGGDAGCFTGDTLVDVFIGKERVQAPIATLVDNRTTLEIPSWNPRKDMEPMRGRIKDWFHFFKLPSQLVEVVLDDGSVIKTTKDHVFYLSDGTGVRAEDLEAGMDLLSIESL